MIGAATFKIETNHEGGGHIIRISGPIDERVEFPFVKSDGVIKIDLENVTRLNSVGVRNWCLWANKYRPPVELHLMNVPSIIINVFSNVHGILNKQTKIISFAIPFYSEVTDERCDIIVQYGVHFRHGVMPVLADVFDSKGNKMVMDVIPDAYFAFLIK